MCCLCCHAYLSRLRPSMTTIELRTVVATSLKTERPYIKIKFPSKPDQTGLRNTPSLFQLGIRPGQELIGHTTGHWMQIFVCLELMCMLCTLSAVYGSHVGDISRLQPTCLFCAVQDIDGIDHHTGRVSRRHSGKRQGQNPRQDGMSTRSAADHFLWLSARARFGARRLRH